MTTTPKPKFNYKEYWKGKREEINEERRRKYREDPVYRAKVRRRAKVDYENTKRAIPIDRRTIQDAKGRKFWSIGRIARLIGRKVLTVRQYHNQGVLPVPKYFDSRGWRLYTQDQAEVLRTVFRRLDDPEDTSVQSLADVTALVAARWDGD